MNASLKECWNLVGRESAVIARKPLVEAGIPYRNRTGVSTLKELYLTHL